MGYICDPNKNTKCRKTMCHINGGPCHYTTDLRCAKTAEDEKTWKKRKYARDYYHRVTKTKRQQEKKQCKDTK